MEVGTTKHEWPVSSTIVLFAFRSKGALRGRLRSRIWPPQKAERAIALIQQLFDFFARCRQPHPEVGRKSRAQNPAAGWSSGDEQSQEPALRPSFASHRYVCVSSNVIGIGYNPLYWSCLTCRCRVRVQTLLNRDALGGVNVLRAVSFNRNGRVH